MWVLGEGWGLRFSPGYWCKEGQSHMTRGMIIFLHSTHWGLSLHHIPLQTMGPFLTHLLSTISALLRACQNLGAPFLSRLGDKELRSYSIVQNSRSVFRSLQLTGGPHCCHPLLSALGAVAYWEASASVSFSWYICSSFPWWENLYLFILIYH